MLLDPFGNLGQVLVLLAEIVLLAEVDQVNDGLGRQKEERVDHFNLISVTVSLLDDHNE
jgi:hypothetical protein